MKTFTGKKVFRNTFFIVSLIALIGTTSFAIAGNHTSAPEGDWELYQEINGVQIYTKAVECNLVKDGIFQEYIMLKFVNTTNQNLTVEWDIEQWYDGKCRTCDVKSGEYHYSIQLDKGSTLQGDCDLTSKHELKIFKRFLNYDDKAELTKFNLANLTVNPN